jgi:hypothetical protein
MSFGILVSAGPLIVGATFLWAGAIKAVAPHVFQAHVRNLGWIPARQLDAAVIVATALEAGWGTALILGVAPRIVLPVTAVTLVALSIVSWWGIHSGRTTDCGCYGGYVVPSLAQSVTLNGVLVAMTLIAWLSMETAGPTATWKLLTSIATGVIAGTLAAISLRFLAKNGRFLVDMSPLKPGRTWHARWGATIPDDGTEHMVSYLGPDCPHCRQWVRVLNAIGHAPGLPQAVGVVAASSQTLDRFVEIAGIRFPMKIIPQSLMSRLVWAVPTTVLVSGGKIQEKWSGQMPPEFFQRFKEAFFPTSAGEPGKNGLEPVTGAAATRNT